VNTTGRQPDTNHPRPDATRVDWPGEALIDHLLERHQRVDHPRLIRLWDYYRNPARNDSGSTGTASRAHHLAQARGLPDRLRPNLQAHPNREPRELVIENDIAWRIHTLVDFMFGKDFVLQSIPADDTPRAQQRAGEIEGFLRETFVRSGGITLFQNLALLGSVYGMADLLVTPDTSNRVRIDAVDATRLIPLVHEDDYRRLDAAILHTPLPDHQPDRSTWWGRLSRWLTPVDHAPEPGVQHRTAVWTDDELRVYAGPVHQRQLVSREPHRFGRIPLVHIQNLPQPFAFAGLSEVEPLIPLQDELNTRLSDRANRVTFQAFKMFLGKGIDDFTDKPVGPGQMWATDNPDAEIQVFGGDADSPSEAAHIQEVREAMDKTSSVTAVAAGLLRNKVGNLTSENALRITMMGLLAKTDRKRVTYGQGIADLCELVLHIAEITGQFHTTPDERRVRLDWPNPLPQSDTDRLAQALQKQRLGVPTDQLLKELGYAD